MDFNFQSTQIDAAFDQFKNVAANSIFDQVTGTIKNTLENSGIAIQAPSQVKPKGSNESEQNELAREAINWTPYLIGGAVLIGGMFLLKKKGIRFNGAK